MPLIALLPPSPLLAPPIARAPFGKTKAGKAVELVTLTNRNGASASVMTRGATLTRLRMPDRSGTLGDVILGADELGFYEGPAQSAYIGVIAGRFANRIAGAKFRLDGRTYRLPANNGPNTLHGGTNGFDRRIWTATPKDTPNGPSVRFTMRDPDGANGFPGAVDAAVTYTLTHGNVLRVQYEARSTKATPISLTQHAYFNLKDAGASPMGGHELQILADRYLPVNAVQIPTRIAPVAGTPIDFRKPKPIGRDLASMGSGPNAGYDHNLVLRKGSRFGRSVFVHEPESGRTMEMWTDQPGVQLYTGNFLDGTFGGRDGATYRQYHGFCLEAQAFPDAPNQRRFPSAVLRPGGVYRQRTEYRFGVR